VYAALATRTKDGELPLYVMLMDMEDSSAHSMLLLGIDTCGPAGSVALARLAGNAIDILCQGELEGRTYSAQLVATIEDLLVCSSLKLREVGCIVAVNGPGSFTGVRVGLSAVKGLAGGAGIPVVAVSRLEVLAGKAGVVAAALDAHRWEVFLRVDGGELLAGEEELAALAAPKRVAVYDEAAAKLLAACWPGAELVRVDAPTAADAMRLAAPRVVRHEFVDLALLDGNYLRRSDAEIHFDEAAQTA
jgi:tRNA threonylcarbamoyladenosine biosynthesis protein TsaB